MDPLFSLLFGVLALAVSLVALFLLKKRIAKKPPLSSTPISKLPVELMLQISTQLPFICQVSLALSCKSSLKLLGGRKAILGFRELHHPREVSSSRFPHRQDAFSTPRWELLLRLQDDCWRLCPGCLKLHPVSEFSGSELAKSANKRTCVFGTLTGLVHLCPCIKVTFRDKLGLMRRLGSSPYIPKKDPWRPALETVNLVSHECNYHYGTTHIRAELSSFLDSNGELVIRTKYDISCVKLPHSIGYLPLCCPHRSISTHIEDLLKSHSYLKSSCSMPYYKYRKSTPCRWCTTSIDDFKFRRHRGKNHTCSFETLRRLGKEKSRADETWYNQTRCSYVNLDREEQFRRDPCEPHCYPLSRRR